MGCPDGEVSGMKKLIAIPLLLICLLCNGASRQDFGSVKVSGLRMPMFNKERLQAFVYSQTGTRSGAEFKLKGVKIDIIKRLYDLDKIRRIDKVHLYKLGAPRQEIDTFWERFPHSDGIVSSPSASINQTTRKAHGSDKILLRSPFLDLNGIGFDASFISKKINIHKDVVIMIKGAKAGKKNSPLKGGKIPGGRADVKITANHMTIDFENNFVVVTGKVTVDDPQATLTCEKITLYLKPSKKVTTKNKSGITVNDGDSNADLLKKSGGSRDLDRIVCEKNVIATRKQSKADVQKNGIQQAFAERAVYKFSDESITLSEGKPRIVSGTDSVSGKSITIWRNSEKMLVEKDCVLSTIVKDNGRYKPAALASKHSVVTCDRMDADLGKNLIVLTGNVKLDDPVVGITCHKVKIKLGEKTGPAATGGKANLMKGAMANMQSKKEIKEIVCIGDVKLTRKIVSSGPFVKQKASANKAVFNLKNNVIALSGNNPEIVRGNDSLRGDQISVNLAKERLITTGNSRIEINTQGKKTDTTSKTSDGQQYKSVMTSDNADLDYGGNKLAFKGNVDLHDPRMKLQCDKLEIFLLSPLQKGKKAVKGFSKKPDSLKLSSNKQIDKIVCTGNVKTTESRGTVNCGYMELRFMERLDKKARAEDSLMSSGGREVSQIICRENVHMVLKRRKPDPKKLAGKDGKKDPLSQSVSDIIVDCDTADLQLRKNYSELVGNVKVDEKRAMLECDKMEIYSVPSAPGSKPAEYEEGEVPERISLGPDKELKKIICLKNVVVTRREVNADTGADTTQKATCGHAVYDVKEQNVVMTRDDPTVSRGKDTVRADKIFLWLDTGEIDMENPKVEEMNLKQLSK
jgi:lipopolysaccharide export system protein LptA